MGTLVTVALWAAVAASFAVGGLAALNGYVGAWDTKRRREAAARHPDKITWFRGDPPPLGVPLDQLVVAVLPPGAKFGVTMAEGDPARRIVAFDYQPGPDERIGWVERRAIARNRRNLAPLYPDPDKPSEQQR